METAKQEKKCCYSGTINQFLGLANRKEYWKNLMISEFGEVFDGAKPGELEPNAWEEEFYKLQDSLKNMEDKDNTYIVFEYKLPEQGGRRPDVLIIRGNQIYVLEFKHFDKLEQEHVDQVIAYARDVAEYHEKSRHMIIKPILVLTRVGENYVEMVKNGACTVVSPDKLLEHLQFNNDTPTAFDLNEWLTSRYRPLPSILESAKLLMDKAVNEFPENFQASCANLPEVEELLQSLVEKAQKEHKIIAAFLTGEPGTGKTLLGLKLAYKADNAVFLSFNQPLIAALQHILKNFSIVRDAIECRGADTFSENVVIYDEAQRISNPQKQEFQNKRWITKNDIINKMNGNEWGVLLIIYAPRQVWGIGQHEGVKKWQEAINSIDPHKSKWEIICPNMLISQFDVEKVNLQADNLLQLKTCLRTRKDKEVIPFVYELLDNNFEKAKEHFEKMDKSFALYITNDLALAKQYCKVRYDKKYAPNASYGIVKSSKGTFGSDIKYLENDMYGKWFVGDKIEGGKSKDLDYSANELQCQGLELDMPIVYWNDDLVWKSYPVTLEDFSFYNENVKLSIDESKEPWPPFKNPPAWFIENVLDNLVYASENSEVIEAQMIEDLNEEYREKFDKICPLDRNIITRYSGKYRFEKTMYQYMFYSKVFNKCRFSQEKELESILHGCKYSFSPDRIIGINRERTDYIKNTYRILLTRGRDGMIIYVPDDKRFEDTYQVLKELGIEELKGDVKTIEKAQE